MIVRLLGEGQFRVDDELLAQLNELDAEVARAVEAGDEQRAVGRSAGARRRRARRTATKLGGRRAVPSDAIVPPEDLSLEEAQELLAGEGFIPDAAAST